MKTKKRQIYFVIPLVALIIFVAYYWNFDQHYTHALAEKAAALQRARDETLQEQNRMRLRAVQEALASQQQRKDEKAAQLAADQKRREDRQAAYQARDQAQIGIAKWHERFDTLTKEVQNAKEQIAKIQADKQSLVEQTTFLDKLTKVTEGNDAGLNDVLTKIAAADDAAAANAAAAARDEANKKKRS